MSGVTELACVSLSDTYLTMFLFRDRGVGTRQACGSGEGEGEGEGEGIHLVPI